MPAPHPAEFRQRAVALARTGDTPIARLARDLQISESCLRNWMAQADADDGGRADRLTSAEKKELAELRRRIRQLEVENEILKRAAAYFARENVLPNWSTRWSVNSPMTISMSRWPAGYWRCPDQAITTGACLIDLVWWGCGARS